MVDEAASSLAKTLLYSHSNLAATKEADRPALLLFLHFQVLEDVLGVTTFVDYFNRRIGRHEKLVGHRPNRVGVRVLEGTTSVITELEEGQAELLAY